MSGGSGRCGTQLRGCPPSCGLPLYAAALSAPPTRSFKQCWCASSENHRRWLPRVMHWVAQRNKGGAQRAGDIRGVIQCVALDTHARDSTCENNLRQTGPSGAVPRIAESSRSTRLMKRDRNTLTPEVAALRIKAAGQHRTAVVALAFRIETVMLDLVPVAHDQW